MKFQNYFPVILLFMLITGKINAQNMDTTKRYIKVPAGYLMVLRQGDDVFSQLENLANTEKIPSANVSGMGFVNAKFGFLIRKRKSMIPENLIK